MIDSILQKRTLRQKEGREFIQILTINVHKK